MVLPAKRGEFLIKTQTQGPSISSNNIPQLKFVQAPAGSCDSSCRFVLSHFSRVWLFVTPRARQPLLSMGFCRQEYSRGLPLLSAGDFPDHGIEPVSPAQAEPGKPLRALPQALSQNKGNSRNSREFFCNSCVGKPCKGFPAGSVGKESSCNTGDTGLIPGSRRSPEEGNSNPLQYFCLGNPMDRAACWATVHGVTEESDTF